MLAPWQLSESRATFVLQGLEQQTGTYVSTKYFDKVTGKLGCFFPGAFNVPCDNTIVILAHVCRGLWSLQVPSHPLSRLILAWALCGVISLCLGWRGRSSERWVNGGQELELMSFDHKACLLPSTYTASSAFWLWFLCIIGWTCRAPWNS